MKNKEIYKFIHVNTVAPVRTFRTKIRKWKNFARDCEGTEQLRFDKGKGNRKVELRKYQQSDCKILTELFYQTVHTVNAGDYTEEQLNVWATGKVDLKGWNQLFQEHFTVVAIDGGMIVGFGDIDHTGYLDHLYVHANHQRRGIAKAICDRLEREVQGRIVTHASITARPFFEKRGYEVIKEQQVERQGIFLTNYVMVKQK